MTLRHEFVNLYVQVTLFSFFSLCVLFLCTCTIDSEMRTLANSEDPDIVNNEAFHQGPQYLPIYVV